MKEWLIIAVAFIVWGGACWAIAYFKGSKKAGNIDNVAKEIDTLAPVLSPVVTYLEDRLPDPYKTKAKTITSIIGQAAKAAEAMWQVGNVGSDQRKAQAISTIQWSLSQVGITPDASTNAIIGKAVDVAVALFLPKSNVAA